MRFLLILLLAGGLSNRLQAQPLQPGEASDSSCLTKAKSVLDEALGFMQRNYYRKKEVDWAPMVAEAKQRLQKAGNCAETYDIVSWCFRQLNESHSFIMPPSRASIYNNGSSNNTSADWPSLVGELKGGLLADSIGYLSIPWVSTTEESICTKVADSLQHLIATIDQSHPKGWIIDLRKNTGGNCWPMIAGLGPLLGDGVCGFFVSDREKIPIVYNKGAAFQGKHLRCSVSTTNYTVRENKPIVVLTGQRTVSSGEIVVIAFRGKENVRFLGEPTAGYTTANATYTLSDNSMLVLSVCQEADRTGRIWSGRILPDELVSNNTHPGLADPAQMVALQKLLNPQP